MRASGITAYGGPFEAFDVPVPEIADDQVLVRVAGAGIGLWDTAVAAGFFGTDRPLPRALGFEGSGAWYAEYVVASPSSTVPAPRTLDLVAAAALPVAGSTAHQSLVDVLAVRPGETVLVSGGAGATGVLAVQLAKHLGATVLATAGPANLEYVRGLGADHVFDHTAGVAAVLDGVREVSPDGVDVLLDTVDGDNFAALTEAVRAGGRAASITPPLPEVRSDITVHPIISIGEERTLREVVRLVDEGILTVAVQDTFGLDDTARAHARLATRRGRGKIILAPGGVPSRGALSAVTVVDRFFTLVGQGDLQGASALFAPDARLHIPESLAYGGTYTGPGGLLEALGTLYGKAEIDFGRGPVLPLGEEQAVAFNRFDRIRLRENPSGEAAVALCEVYTVRDGKVVEARIWYRDTAALTPVLAGF